MGCVSSLVFEPSRREPASELNIGLQEGRCEA